MSATVSRVLYKSLCRTCKRYDTLILRSRHLPQQPRLPILRARARDTRVPNLQQGFDELRKLRVELAATERWYGALNKSTRTFEEGAIALACAADRKANQLNIRAQINELVNEVKRQFEMDSTLDPTKPKGVVLLHAIPQVLKSLGYRAYAKNAIVTIEDIMIDKFFTTKRGTFNIFSVISKIIADRLDVTLDLVVHQSYVIATCTDLYNYHFYDWGSDRHNSGPQQQLEPAAAAKVYHSIIQLIIEFLEANGRPTGFWYAELEALSPFLTRITEAPEEEEKEVNAAAPSVQSETKEHAL